MSPAARGDGKALVLQATDIVELIGQSVALKRRGKSFVGLCPFHQEKTPSFHVDAGKQFFHCFGCKASGNAIDFVMKRDRVEFLDALRSLADRAGIELPRSGGGDRQKASERQLLFDAQSQAAAFFENSLNDEAVGAKAREYLAGRGFSPEIIRQFRIGLALESWDALLRSPLMKKYPPGVMAAAGLVKARQNGEGFYDTFRNRIMFPIMEEAQARIIAFGGRQMPDGDEPKYLNSPETPLFSKSRCVYGLNFARQRMIETGTAVIVEGYTDVVMAHQYGVTNVVSILGTAMTEQHVNLLKRFAEKRIVLLFDADEAGDTAVDRSVELFLTKDVEIAIASLPEGVDPDEYVMQNGAAAFDQMIAGAPDVLSYKWSQLSRNFRESGDLTSQQKAVGTYLDLLAAARSGGTIDSIRWHGVLSRVSRLTEMPLDVLEKRFRQVRPARPASLPAQPAPQAEEAKPQPEAVEEKIPLARELAERQMLGILLKEPHRWQSICQAVHPEDFADGGRRVLAELYWQHQQDIGEPVFSEFLGELPTASLKELAVSLIELVEAIDPLEEMLNGALGYMEEQRRRREEQKQMAEVRRISDQAASDEATAAFAAFVKNNQAADLRRLGPIRRNRPGS